MIDYAEYLPELRTTTLFRGMDDSEILAVLEAMQPPYRLGQPIPPEEGDCHTAFRMVIRSTPTQKPKVRRFKYDMPTFGEPGMLMAIIPTLSCKDEFIKRTDLSIKPSLPEVDFKMETLEFTPEMITAFYSSEVAPAQGKMLRNLLGMLAQRVVDTRQKLYLIRNDYDIYAESNFLPGKWRDVAQTDEEDADEPLH